MAPPNRLPSSSINNVIWPLVCPSLSAFSLQSSLNDSIPLAIQSSTQLWSCAARWIVSNLSSTAALFFVSFSNRFIKDLNSKTLIFSYASGVNISCTLHSSNFTPSLQSVLIVASFLLRRASFVLFFTASFARFGVISSTCAMAFSTVPNNVNIFTAVFSPTPGTPGILSEESPISPLRSMICSGVTPYSSMTCGRL